MFDPEQQRTNTDSEVLEVFLPVDGDAFNDSILTVLKCEPVMKFDKDGGDSGQQDKDRRSGLLLWRVTVAYEHEADFEPENCQVRVASEKEPGLVPGPVRFGGLAFRTWNMNGKKGLSIAAESWTQEPAPSSKRSAARPPVPEADAAGSKS